MNQRGEITVQMMAGMAFLFGAILLLAQGALLAYGTVTVREAAQEGVRAGREAGGDACQARASEVMAELFPAASGRAVSCGVDPAGLYVARTTLDTPSLLPGLAAVTVTGESAAPYEPDTELVAG